MRWYELALNPQSLERLYDIVPELENVELFSINLSCENSRIQIRFDLPSFPENPPKKWHEEFNRAQIHLSFFDITDFEAKGWHNSLKVKIALRRAEKFLRVIISNADSGIFFSFSCGCFRIERISGYRNSY
jgi:hypothetical protein